MDVMKRDKVDPKFYGGKVVREINANAKVIYFRYKVDVLWYNDRDFYCALQTKDIEESCYIVISSIDELERYETEGSFVRGNISYLGWCLTPISENVTDVTYVSLLSAEGLAPSGWGNKKQFF